MLFRSQGVIARDRSGDVLGAAWLRLGGIQGPYQLADKHVPELAMAVIPQARCRGVGSVLMSHLIESARSCYSQIILSVREDNPAVHFYSRFGFREVSRIKNRVGGESLVMSIDLAPLARPQNPVGGIHNA